MAFLTRLLFGHCALKKRTTPKPKPGGLTLVYGPFGLIFSAGLTLTAQVLVFFTSCICFIENKVRNTFRAIHISTEVKIRNRIRFYHHFTEFKVRNKVRFDRLRHSLQKSFSEENSTVTPDRRPGRSAVSPNGPVFGSMLGHVLCLIVLLIWKAEK